MEQPTRPSREPDLCLDIIVFWWDEGLKGNHFDEVCRVRYVKNVSYYLNHSKMWSSLFLSKKEKDLVRASYAKWLLEKELRS